ncbi:MAG: hypothetical protein M0D57_06285 [Sphingobacteriales bacterium JAD_PAG50586_3]|nr:MAG: hypothetical protein M0D57_06285 [Sphingobacteriales bacterium JAD_PAG50586_3]
MKNLVTLLYILCLVGCSIAIVFFIFDRSDVIENKKLLVFSTIALLIFSVYRLSMLTKTKPTDLPGSQIQNTIELPVDLTNVIIESTSYTIDRPAEIWETGDTRLLDNLVGHNMVPKKDKIEQCHFKYSVTYNNTTLTFVSPIINKDRETLHIKLLIQKNTILYANRDNLKEHYLDLDFLHN